MISLTLYFLVSSSLFFSTILELAIKYQDAYEAFSMIFNEKKCRFFFVNFCISLLCFLIKIILNLLLGHTNLSNWRQTFSQINRGFLYDIVLCLPSLLFNSDKVYLGLLITPLLVSILSYLNITIVDSLAISQHAGNLNIHRKIMVFQLLLFFFSLYVFCKYLIYFSHSNELYICMLCTISADSTMNTLLQLMKHVIFLTDLKTLGASERSIRYNFLVQLIIEVIQIFIYILMSLYGMAVGLQSYFYNSLKIAFLINSFEFHIFNYKNWNKLMPALNSKLPNATQEDLSNENICVICRLEMTPGEAKKLPCGHCYHLSCLQQWITQKMKCPLCQYNLNGLIEEEENLFQRFFGNLVFGEEFERLQRNRNHLMHHHHHHRHRRHRRRRNQQNEEENQNNADQDNQQNNHDEENLNSGKYNEEANEINEEIDNSLEINELIGDNTHEIEENDINQNDGPNESSESSNDFSQSIGGNSISTEPIQYDIEE